MHPERALPCREPPVLQHFPACRLLNPWGLDAGCLTEESQSSREKQKTAQWPQNVFGTGVRGMRARTLLLPPPLGGMAWGRQQAGKPLQHRQAGTWVHHCGTGQSRPCSPCHHGHTGHESPGCWGWQRCRQPALLTYAGGRQPDFKLVLNYSWHYRGSRSTRSWTPGLCWG